MFDHAEWSRANRERINANHRRWVAENPEAMHRYTLRQYGLTPEDYDQLLASQSGACAICGEGPGAKRFHVDHDHETGVVRGLLCGPCNRALGYFKDDANRLLAAAAYLIQHEEVLTPWSSST